MQASFSFFGSEVPGIVSRKLSAIVGILIYLTQAAGEVIDATRVRFIPSSMASTNTNTECSSSFAKGVDQDVRAHNLSI